MTSLARLGTAVLALAIATEPAPSAADAVGVTGAVNPQATGTPPGAPTRPLILGSEVLFNERIVTGPGGQAHVLFLDQSSMIVGENSTVVIDRFVYNPAAGTGEMSATLARGALRFIGGKLSQQGQATLRTPVVTIGIRGTDVSVSHDQATNVMVGFGNATVTPNGCVGPACAAIVPTGRQITVGVTGQPPGGSQPISQGDAQRAKSNSEGQAGRSAGAPVPPTDGAIARSVVAGIVQNQPPGPPPLVRPILPVIADRLGCDPNCTQNPGPPPTLQTGLSGVFKMTVGAGTNSAQVGTRNDGTGAAFNDPSFYGPNTRVFSNGVLINGDLGASINAFGATLTTRPSPLFPVASPPPDTLLAVGIVTGVDGKHTLAAPGPAIADPPYNGLPVLMTALPDPGPPDPPLPGQLRDVNDTVFDALDRGFFGMKLDLRTSDPSCSPGPVPCVTGDYALLFGGTPVSGSELITRNGTGGVDVRLFGLYHNVEGDSVPLAFMPSGLGSFATAPRRFNSPLYLATPDNSNPSYATGRALYVGIAMSDTIADGKSGAVVALGGVGTASAVSPTFPQVSMAVRGSALLGPFGDPTQSYIIGGTTTSSPDGQGRSMYGPATGADAGTTQFFVLDENGRGSAFSGSTAYQNRATTITDFDGPPSSLTYGYNHIAEKVGTFAPGTRSELTLQGFVGGAGELRTSSLSPVFRLLTSDPITSTAMDSPNAGLIIKTNPQSDNSRLMASLTFRRDGWSAGTQFTQLLLGHDPAAATDVASAAAYIDNTIFAATDRDFSSTVTGVTTPGGLQSPSAFLKPNAALAGAPAASSSYLFTVGALQDPTAGKTGEQVLEGMLGLASGTIQPNAYLSWGFWGGEVRGPATFAGDGSQNGLRARTNLATWVAGELPSPSINSSGFGTATFSGNAIGTVVAGGVQYLAAGGFTNVYNFGTASGTVTISSFDGRNVTGPVNALITDWRQYQGASLANSGGPGTTGTLTGAFYAPAPSTNIPLATGGNFIMKDSTNPATWSAAGVLVGKR